MDNHKNMYEDVQQQNKDEQQENNSHVCVQCEKAAEELSRIKKQYEYLSSDFENCKRRFAHDVQQAHQEAAIKIFQDILNLVDDFECALKEISTCDDERLAQHLKGFDLMYRAYMRFLMQHGVAPVEQNTIFDPQLHEAVMVVPDSGKEAGTIIDVFERGYMFNGLLLRPAKVSVAQ
jgi:molecular chaperone GrpE